MQLRIATPGDGEGLRAIYAPFVTSSPITFETVEPTAEEMGRRVANTLPTYPWIVAVDAHRTNPIAGYAYGGPYASRAAYQWSAEVSVYLRDDARGKGLGRTLYTALFEILDAQGFRQLVAGITTPNPASFALHAAMGFEVVGTFQAIGWKQGAWHDVKRLQRPLGSDRLSPPSDLRTVDELDPGVIDAALTIGSAQH